MSIKLSFLIVLFLFYNYLFTAISFLKLSEVWCNPLEASLCKMQYEKQSIFYINPITISLLTQTPQKHIKHSLSEKFLNCPSK